MSPDRDPLIYGSAYFVYLESLSPLSVVRPCQDITPLFDFLKVWGSCGDYHFKLKSPVSFLGDLTRYGICQCYSRTRERVCIN